MQKAKVAALALTCVASAFCARPALADTSYVTGEAYMAMSDDLRTVYVEGLFDMLSRMTRAVDNPQEAAFLNRAARCTSGMDSGQLRDFVDTYMRSDNSYRSYGMASNFRAALNAKCPS